MDTPTAVVDRGDRPARRRRRGPGRARDPGRLASADAGHAGRSGRGRHRPAPRRRQRARPGRDARRAGDAGRRRTGLGGARPRARRVPARRTADRLGPRPRTAARRADGRRGSRGAGRRPGGGGRAVRVRHLGLPRTLPSPRRGRPDGRRGHPLDVDVGAGGPARPAGVRLHPQRGARQGAALRRLLHRGARPAALDGRRARAAAAGRRPASTGRSTSPGSSPRCCRWATRPTTATGPAR